MLHIKMLCQLMLLIINFFADLKLYMLMFLFLIDDL